MTAAPESVSLSPLRPEYQAVFRRAAAVLTSSLELETALANTISICLPALGDFGFFDVQLDEGVKRTARAHLNPELEQLLNQTTWQRAQRTDINLCALSTGEPVVHPDTNDTWFAHAFEGAPRFLAFRSMLSVPVRYGDELIGSLTLFMDSSGRKHNQADLDFATELASLAAPIVANARLRERQERAQTALKLSEERLRVATDAGKIGIWDWDIINDKINWSDRVYELHGLDPEHFKGRVTDYAQLLHPDDRARSWQKIQEAVAHGDSFTNEFRSLWPDGSVHWLSTWAHVYRDEQGKAVRMVGSSIDITDQKNKEAGLSNRNAQLEERALSSETERDRIWLMSQDILVVASLKGYLLSVNPAISKILGWTQKEALVTPLLEFVHPQQHAEVKEALASLALGNPVEGIDIRCVHRDGSNRWLSWTIVPEGEQLFAVGRDITELRRQRQAILNATEKRLQFALEVGGMGAWQWDIQSDKVTWWPGMDKLHGLPPGTTLKHIEDYVQFVHPDDLDVIRGSVANAAIAANKGIEYRVVWPDGTVRWIEGRGELFFDEHGTAIRRAGILTDITRRKRTEQNLRFLAQASEALAELVDHNATLAKVAELAVPSFADWCTVDLLDEQGKLVRVAVAHADPAKVALAQELHRRYPSDPNSPRGAWNIVRTGKPELIEEISDQMLEDSLDDKEYLAIIRKLGLRSYLGVPLQVRGKILGVATFVSAESGRPYNRDDVELAEDLGRRAAIAVENSLLYRSLREADRRKDDFLAMLAHELRNPLAPILAAANILKVTRSDEILCKTSEVISRQVTHMTALVDDLLDVSRVTKGHVAIKKHPVDSKLAINAAVEQVRPLIEKHLHQLTLAIGAAPLYIEGDEKRLVQIIANLLNNAARYTPDGGTIELRAETRDDWVEISVTDNGIGMSAHLIQDAFKLFVQGERTADRSQGGLGLGLALVKSLAELHGGTVTVSSAGPGCGSSFMLRLPRLKNPPVAATNTGTAMDDLTQTLHILVVDDNVDAAEMLQLFLEMSGQQVSITHSPVDALALLDSQIPEVVLLDIGLPIMDGYQLARRIREKLGEQTPLLIALSGYGQEKDREAAVAAGIDHYLVKPLDTAKLLSILKGE